MTTETKRDLHADLAICDAATPSKWFAERNTYLPWSTVYTSGEISFICERVRRNDATFIAEARQGWPEAIRRAIAAEAEIERLKGEVEHWKRETLKRYPTSDAYDAACAALHKHRERADVAEAEVKHLRQVLELMGKGWKFKKGN